MLHFGAPQLSVQKQALGSSPLPVPLISLHRGSGSLPTPTPGVLHPAANWGNEGAVPQEGSSSPALPPASPQPTLRQLLLLPWPPEVLRCYQDSGWNPDGLHLSHLPGDSEVPPGLPTTHLCPLAIRELSKAKWDMCHQGMCTGPWKRVCTSPGGICPPHSQLPLPGQAPAWGPSSQ